MTTSSDGTKKPTTMHEIAATLVNKRPETSPPIGEDESIETEEEIIEEDDQEDQDADDVSAGDEDDDTDKPEADETLEDEEGENEEDESDGSDDDADELDDEGFLSVSDDDMIEVKIDGKVELRSIADAKKALSGEGAIDKRLQEATERRKTAQADHTLLLNNFSQAHQNLMQTVRTVADYVAPPMVNKPDQNLKNTNQDLYYRQLAEYQEDQKRVAGIKEQFGQLLQNQSNELKKGMDEYKKQQASLLVERIPALRDPEKSKTLLTDLSTVAKQYGFSDEEISQAMDHRYYLMIADLHKFLSARGAVDRKANTVKNLASQESKRPRKLRSGATSIKVRATQKSKEQKAATDTARKSGKVKDIAKTLIR